MLTLIILVLLTCIGHSVVQSQAECLGPHCICANEVLNCTCQSRENIGISTVVNFDIKSIIIRHCGTVTITSMAFIHLRLNSMIIDDILELKIRPIAFYGGVMSHLSITNIADLQGSAYGLNGLNNMSLIELTNITSELIPHTFLVASEIKTARITNCSFQDVSTQAFAFANTTEVVVRNSKMETLRSRAFTITGNTKTVSFEQDTFKLTENASFHIESSKLAFQLCYFEELYNEVFQVEYVDRFIFDSNTITLARNEAFLYLNSNGSVQFVNNSFHHAEEFSLTMLLSPSMNEEIANNTFNCNCALDWFWQQSFTHIRKSSLCLIHGSLVQARDVELDYDEEGRCVELTIANSSHIDYEPDYGHYHETNGTYGGSMSPTPMMMLTVALGLFTVMTYTCGNIFESTTA